MKKFALTALIAINSMFSFAQTTIEWSPDYQLQFSDFKSGATEIGGNNLSIYPAAKFDFSFQMSNYEFMFTKNFNSKVVTNFYPQSAYYTAPDSLLAKDLLQYARLTFDLTELYARKFRQQLYLKKGGFSDASFFQPIYNEIEKEYSVRHSALSKATELGRNHEATKIAQQQILTEISLLSDFCKTCKPKKKKKD